jgi:hypothetical protein
MIEDIGTIVRHKAHFLDCQICKETKRIKDIELNRACFLFSASMALMLFAGISFGKDIVSIGGGIASVIAVLFYMCGVYLVFKKEVDKP